jgi:TolA-binding protein
VLAGLLHQPSPVYGQSKEIGALQRDIYDVIRKLEELKGSQGEKSAQLETLLKQVMDANAALTAELKGIQDSTRKTQTDQQSLVISPLNALKVSVDDTSADVAGMQGVLGTMRTRQEKMEGVLNDLSAQMRIVLQQTEHTQPATPVSAAPSASDAVAILFAAAEADRLSGKGNFALQSLGEISQKYPDSPYAPMAMFEIGSLYAENEEYGEALKAFDRVLEQYGDNPMRKDAQFRKAEQLANLGRKADAVKEFNSFAKQYPGDDKAPEAISRAKELSAPAAPANTKAKQPARPKGRTK